MELKNMIDSNGNNNIDDNDSSLKLRTMLQNQIN